MGRSASGRSSAVFATEELMTNEEYRIAVAVRVCHMFRIALERNGDRYHGGLVPNLTSITDCLIIPFDVLKRTVDADPDLDPEKPFDPFTWQPPVSSFVRAH